jgi:predicted MFS family arabinose efflux permease
MAGGLLVAASEELKQQGYVVLLTLIGLGASITGFALSRWLLLSCLLIFLSGVAMMASASLLLSLVQLIVSDQMRGRVMSVYNLAFRLGIPLGGLGLGKVIPLIGVSAALADGICPGRNRSLLRDRDAGRCHLSALHPRSCLMCPEGAPPQ